MLECCCTGVPGVRCCGSEVQTNTNYSYYSSLVTDTSASNLNFTAEDSIISIIHYITHSSSPSFSVLSPMLSFLKLLSVPPISRPLGAIHHLGQSPYITRGPTLSVIHHCFRCVGCLPPLPVSVLPAAPRRPFPLHLVEGKASFYSSSKGN